MWHAVSGHLRCGGTLTGTRGHHRCVSKQIQVLELTAETDAVIMRLHCPFANKYKKTQIITRTYHMFYLRAQAMAEEKFKLCVNAYNSLCSVLKAA
jgi:hypothetical protein